MKLKLVMLATVFSMMTERQVEAQVRCYENGDFTGLNAMINKSIQNLTSLFPNGARACNITAKFVLIFYSEPGYRGEIIAVNGDDKKIVPRFGFTVKSILMIGNQTIDGRLLLFKEENFQGGVLQSFNPQTKNVRGNITFGSAVVLGDTLYWTVVRRCQLDYSNGQCFVCLGRAKSRASFIIRIDSTDVWETEAIFPEACAGTNYTGESSIRGEREKVLICYEDRNLWGSKAIISDSINNITSKIKSGARACIVKYSSWIFYNDTNFNGKSETVHSGSDGYVYYPSSISIIKSIKKLTNSVAKCTGNTYQVGNKCQKCNCHVDGKKKLDVPGGGYKAATSCDPTGQCPCGSYFEGKQCDIPKHALSMCAGPGSEYCYACTITQVEGAQNPTSYGCETSQIKLGCKVEWINGQKGYTCYCAGDYCNRKKAKKFESATYRNNYPLTD